MNVILTPESEELVQKIVDSRRFHSPGDVVSEALRQMAQNDQTIALRKAEIRLEIDDARASLARGEGIDGDEFFDRIEAEFDALECNT